jgi:uncharacterized coiled-coil protein SlyX
MKKVRRSNESLRDNTQKLKELRRELLKSRKEISILKERYKETFEHYYQDIEGDEYKELRRLGKKEFMNEKRFHLFYDLFIDSWSEAIGDKIHLKKTIYHETLKEAVDGLEDVILKRIEDCEDSYSLYSKYLETINKLESELEMPVDLARKKIREIYERFFSGKELSLLDRIFYYVARGSILEESLANEERVLNKKI